eukprot:6820812-Alexandrium_andersonii.AAC.1
MQSHDARAHAIRHHNTRPPVAHAGTGGRLTHMGARIAVRTARHRGNMVSVLAPGAQITRQE